MERKVKYYIDDLKWFQLFYKFTEQQMEEIFKDKDSFKVILILIGKEKYVDRYELTDYDGNKISRNSLNGYQRGIILNDCYAHFGGGKYSNGLESPCGVVKVIEEEIEEA